MCSRLLLCRNARPRAASCARCALSRLAGQTRQPGGLRSSQQPGAGSSGSAAGTGTPTSAMCLPLRSQRSLACILGSPSACHRSVASSSCKQHPSDVPRAAAAGSAGAGVLPRTAGPCPCAAQDAAAASPKPWHARPVAGHLDDVHALLQHDAPAEQAACAVRRQPAPRAGRLAWPRYAPMYSTTLGCLQARAGISLCRAARGAPKGHQHPPDAEVQAPLSPAQGLQQRRGVRGARPAVVQDGRLIDKGRLLLVGHVLAGHLQTSSVSQAQLGPKARCGSALGGPGVGVWGRSR